MAIETITPGDVVMAFDPAGGTWAPRPVRAQWSYLDTDEMATLTLTDGSVVTATDHHRFYNTGDARFEALENLEAGDRLATPDGQVSVAAVAVWPSAPTLVWELTVELDHTFAVYAGDHAVAVHNQDDPGCIPAPDAPTTALGGLDDLAARRGALGAPPAGPGVSPTLSRLDVDGMGPLYGTSGHGRPISLRVNPISRTHAETDVLQQFADLGGAGGGRATLYVDYPAGLCGAFGRSGAVASMARPVGTSELTVVWPGGQTVIVP